MTDERENPGGAPEGNDNAVTHGLYADKQKMFERLDEEERRLVVEVATDLLDKFEGEVGAYERYAIRNVALDVLKRLRANDYILEEDLIRDEDESAERVNMAYSRLVRDTTSELEKLGLLEEGPELRKAEAQEGWMAKLSEAQDAVDEHDE